MDTEKTIQRRQLIVDPKLQYGLIVKFAVFVTITLISSLILLTFIFNKFTNVALPVSLETGGVTSFEASQFIRFSDLIWPVLIVVLVSIILSSLIVYFLGILFTHRMAGPVYRLRKDLAEMTDGGLEKRVSFREKDYFQLLATDIDGLRQQWHNSVKEIKAISMKLNDATEEEKKELLGRLNTILSDLLKTFS
jgi:methyl-accepting chemotaxis protein